MHHSAARDTHVSATVIYLSASCQRRSLLQKRDRGLTVVSAVRCHCKDDLKLKHSEVSAQLQTRNIHLKKKRKKKEEKKKEKKKEIFILYPFVCQTLGS